MRRRTIALDFDGTLVKSAWPHIGKEFPGVVDGVKELLAAGHEVYVFSVRANTRDPWTNHDYPPAESYERQQAIRTWLDDRGLQAVGIHSWNKPIYDILVDDRAMFFPGNDRAWKHIPTKVLARLAKRR